MKYRTALFTRMVLTLCLAGGLHGCASTPQALQPVVTQNQKNMDILSANVQILLALYEPLMQSAGEAALTQYIGKIQQEMIAVLGPPSLPPPGKSWDKLFEQADGTPLAHQEKYLERYRFMSTAVARGITADNLQALTQGEGWIYTAAADPAFTPQKAHEILRALTDARRDKSDMAAYYAQAETLLSPYEPMLRHHRAILSTAQAVFAGLREEINNELRLGLTHGQQLQNYVSGTVGAELVPPTLDNKKIADILGFLGKKYLKDSTYLDAAVKLLTVGLEKSK